MNTQVKGTAEMRCLSLCNLNNEYFYATHTFYSLEDFKKQLSVHNRKYNNFPMRPLDWKSPADYLKAFLINGEVF